MQQGVAPAGSYDILDASPKGGAQMNAIYMTDQQLADADMTFNVAVEIILRGNFPKDIRDKA